MENLNFLLSILFTIVVEIAAHSTTLLSTGSRQAGQAGLGGLRRRASVGKSDTFAPPRFCRE